MKISELIWKLTVVKDFHGDLPVEIRNEVGEWEPAVEVDTKYDHPIPATVRIDNGA